MRPVTLLRLAIGPWAYPFTLFKVHPSSINDFADFIDRPRKALRDPVYQEGSFGKITSPSLVSNRSPTAKQHPSFHCHPPRSLLSFPPPPLWVALYLPTRLALISPTPLTFVRSFTSRKSLWDLTLSCSQLQWKPYVCSECPCCVPLQDSNSTHWKDRSGAAQSIRHDPSSKSRPDSVSRES